MDAVDLYLTCPSCRSKKGHLRYKPATAARANPNWRGRPGRLRNSSETSPERLSRPGGQADSGLTDTASGGDFGSEVHLFPFNTFAHFKTNETNQLSAVGLQQLTNGLLRVLHERLLHKAVLLEELLDTAAHHLLDDFSRLAFHVRLGTDDFLLFLNFVRRHVFRLANTGVNRCRVHGNVTGNFRVTRCRGDNRGNLVVAVNVTAHNRAFNLHNTTHGDVLADLLNQRFALGFQIAFHQLGNVALATLKSSGEHFVGEVQEVLITGNKVGFRVDFNNVGDGIVVSDLHQRHAFSSGTACFLGGLQTG